MTPITALGSRYGIQGALGRSVKRASSASTWWNLNGTITSCIAAYQPKGAADISASWVNLANPGTYNASQGNGTITWSSTDGWIIDAAGDRIDTGITIPASANSLSYSVIAYVSIDSLGNGTNYGRLFEVDNDNDFFILPFAGAYRIYFRNGGELQYLSVVGGESDIITVGFSKNKGYYNGSYVSDIPDGTVNGGSLYIGNRADNARTMDGNIYAFAIYNTELSETQMGALHTAMAAL